jgi:hypothetical protein
MYIRPTAFNVLTVVMMLLTAWVIWARFTKSLESSWPLVYYLGIVIYLKAFEGALDPYWVYVGVVSGLFLRFEFMGGLFLKMVRAVELVVLGYFLWRGYGLLMMW